MNIYSASLVLEPRRCRKSLSIRLRLPVITCFLGLESKNLRHLDLIPSRPAGATRTGGSPREAQAIRAGDRGIRNPRCRLPDLASRQLSAQALSDLLDRQPHLLRRLAAQLIAAVAIDPAERLGIDLSSLRTAEDCRQMLATVLATFARGGIPPAEGAPIARRVRAGLRAVTRRARFSYSELRGPPQIEFGPDDRECPDQIVDIGLAVQW
jgi:hypothetical protein